MSASARRWLAQFMAAASKAQRGVRMAAESFSPELRQLLPVAGGEVYDLDAGLAPVLEDGWGEDAAHGQP